jgi:Spy/CpxP family protein refolding chaperone
MLSLTGQVFAQGKADMQAKHKQFKQDRIERLTQELNLTPEQKDKISVIMDEKMAARKEDIKKMHEGQKGIDNKIESVLTPEQKVKFAGMKSAQKDKMKQHQGKKPNRKSNKNPKQDK